MVYDGLEVVRIPMSYSEIFTASVNCFQSVKNVMPVDVCISETEGSALYNCEEFTYKRYLEWDAPSGGEDDPIFC